MGFTDRVKSLITTVEKQTPEELKQIQQARQDLKNRLQADQGFIATARKNETWSPDGSQEALRVIQEAFTWLKENPNANFLEIVAESDRYNEAFKEVVEREPVKNALLNMCYWIFAFDKWLKDMLKEKYTEKQSKAFLKLSDKYQSWSAKNPKKDPSEYLQKIDELRQDVQNVPITSGPILGNFTYNTKDANQTKSPVKTKREIEAWSKDIQIKEAKVFNTDRLLKNYKDAVSNVFLIILIVILCLFSGSLLANQAIGRKPFYRFVYFCVGLIPWVVPFVYIYAAYRVLRGNPIAYYTLLPLTTNIPESKVSQFMLLPFWYVADQKANDETSAWNRLVETIGFAVANAPSPPVLPVGVC